MVKTAIKRLIGRLGYDLVKHQPPPPFPVDFDQEAIDIVTAVRPYTITSDERIFALIQAVKYLAKARVNGCIVECGVWRGGKRVVNEPRLLRLGERTRQIAESEFDYDPGAKIGGRGAIHFEPQELLLAGC